MKVTPTALAGVVVVEPRVFTDARGFFFESYHAERYRAAGLPGFVQDNHSRSVPGTLRGLHYQIRHQQGKLIRVLRGAIYDVAVDIRPRSPAFGQWVAVELSAANQRQLYVPPGFAHGFCVPHEESEVEYKCTDYYSAADERGILWSSPSLKIPWPVTSPLLSDKDLAYPALDRGLPDLPELVAP